MAIRSIKNTSILQCLAPLVNLNTSSDTETIKQALITKYPMNALIIICKPKKTSGLQALCAPADLMNYVQPELPSDFPKLLIDGGYEYTDTPIDNHWTRISYSSRTNTLQIISLQKQDGNTLPPETPSPEETPKSEQALPKPTLRDNLEEATYSPVTQPPVTKPSCEPVEHIIAVQQNRA